MWKSCEERSLLIGHKAGVGYGFVICVALLLLCCISFYVGVHFCTLHNGISYYGPHIRDICWNFAVSSLAWDFNRVQDALLSSFRNFIWKSMIAATSKDTRGEFIAAAGVLLLFHGYVTSQWFSSYVTKKFGNTSMRCLVECQPLPNLWQPSLIN